MGYNRDNAIIVSSWDDTLLKKAHEKATELLTQTVDRPFETSFVRLLSSIIPAVVNGGGSFMIGPDGSKEGWSTSDTGDYVREEFKAWLRAQGYDDGTTSLNWVEVQWNDDDGVTKVTEADNVDP